MFKLKSDTWYYTYYHEGEIFISDVAPNKGDDNKWYHPENGYRCKLPCFRVPPKDEDEMKIYKCSCCNELIGERALIISELLKIKTCPKCGSNDVREPNSERNKQ